MGDLPITGDEFLGANGLVKFPTATREPPIDPHVFAGSSQVIAGCFSWSAVEAVEVIAIGKHRTTGAPFPNVLGF